MPPKPRTSTPKPPRVGSSGGPDRRSLWIAIAAAAGLLVVIGLLGAFVLGSGSDTSSESADAALKAAGCTVVTVNALKGEHSILTPGGTSKKWNTDPPTSGPHYEVPAIWGVYTEPLQPAQVVHNLEHGGIFILYGSDVPAATVDELRAFYNDHVNGTLLAPLPRLGDKIALGAWVSSSATNPDDAKAHLAKCTTFDEKGFSAFFDAYQFKGPERFPASSLTPGS